MAHKVFIFVPGFGGIITATTFLSTHALRDALSAKGIGGGISTLSFPDIGELRDMATTIWHDAMPDVSHILFVDSDMGFSPDVVLDMLMFDEPVVGAIYPQRRVPTSWAGSGNGGETTERRANFMKVEGVGMGCTLIRRDAIEKILAKFPDVIDSRIKLHPACATLESAGVKRLLRLFNKVDLPDRGILSEDLSFCWRWNQCGGSVWGSVGHRFSHVGQHDFGGFSYLEHLARVGTPAAPVVAAASPVVELPAPSPVVVVPDAETVEAMRTAAE